MYTNNTNNTNNTTIIMYSFFIKIVLYFYKIKVYIYHILNKIRKINDTRGTSFKYTVKDYNDVSKLIYTQNNIKNTIYKSILILNLHEINDIYINKINNINIHNIKNNNKALTYKFYITDNNSSNDRNTNITNIIKQYIGPNNDFYASKIKPELILNNNNTSILNKSQQIIIKSLLGKEQHWNYGQIFDFNLNKL
jgi:hypothetical protein